MRTWLEGVVLLAALAGLTALALRATRGHGTLDWRWECVEPGRAQIDARWIGDRPADSLRLVPGGGSTFTVEVWLDDAIVFAETQEIKGCAASVAPS